MADCLLLNSLLRSIRNARTRTDAKNASGAKIQNGNASGNNGAEASTSTAATGAKRPPAPAPRRMSSSADAKSEDGAAFLPGLLSDFRSDLVQLQDTVRRDLEELETLRLQNAVLREQLAERDRIIASLQRQLRGGDNSGA